MPTQEQMEKLEESYLDEFYEAAHEYYATAIKEGHSAEMRVRSMSPVLSFFAIRRQEELSKTQRDLQQDMNEGIAHLEGITQDMQKESKMLTRLTWAIFALTGVVVAVAALQVILMSVRD